ncbi:protein BEAN1 [Thalassophryne amazonica]|uniref:protein BEAN1 n=1 Tax=Thalassophryne amazonica TaxID=390379 RepID=UPI00147251A3|nr:protein BEAN1 [Thalassophryne amazonica]
MLMKLICSVSSNQSHGEYPDCHTEAECDGPEASLLVSPLVVAGIVIGLVLFLSCITIIIGSLRKDSRQNPQLQASYGPDGFSFGGSIGELRSICLEDFPPGLDFDSYGETLSQVNNLYPNSPPRYDECIGDGATQIYIPTDDPPPYSLLDPCQRGAGLEEEPNYTSPDLSSYFGETAATGIWFSSCHGPMGLQEEEQQRIASITFLLEAAPPYESVLAEQERHLPLMPCDHHKHQSEREEEGHSQQVGANQT